MSGNYDLGSKPVNPTGQPLPVDKDVEKKEPQNPADTTKADAAARGPLGGSGKTSRLQRLTAPWRRPSSEQAKSHEPPPTRYARMVATVKNGVTRFQTGIRKIKEAAGRKPMNIENGPPETPVSSTAKAAASAPAATHEKPSLEVQLKDLQKERKSIQGKRYDVQVKMHGLLGTEKRGNLTPGQGADLEKMKRQLAGYTSQIKKLDNQIEARGGTVPTMEEDAEKLMAEMTKDWGDTKAASRLEEHDQLLEGLLAGSPQTVSDEDSAKAKEEMDQILRDWEPSSKQPSAPAAPAPAAAPAQAAPTNNLARDLKGFQQTFEEFDNTISTILIKLSAGTTTPAQATEDIVKARNELFPVADKFKKDHPNMDEDSKAAVDELMNGFNDTALAIKQAFQEVRSTPATAPAKAAAGPQPRNEDLDSLRAAAKERRASQAPAAAPAQPKESVPLKTNAPSPSATSQSTQQARLARLDRLEHDLISALHAGGKKNDRDDIAKKLSVLLKEREELGPAEKQQVDRKLRSMVLTMVESRAAQDPVLTTRKKFVLEQIANLRKVLGPKE